MFNATVLAAIRSVALDHNIEPAALSAIVGTESGGIASPIAGKVKNPTSPAERYKMFTRMCDIDKEAAIMSCNWGVGQVMGAH